MSRIALLTCCCFIAMMIGRGFAEDTLHVVPLRDNWTLWSTASPTTFYHPVTVPNTVLGALVNLNNAGSDLNPRGSIFPSFEGSPDPYNPWRYQMDPFYHYNLNLIDKEDFAVPWVFQRVVNVAEISSLCYYVLQVNGINYRANVSVNGVQVGPDLQLNGTEQELVGGVRRYLLDVNSVINRNADNVITIAVSAPENSWTTDFSFSFLDWAPFPADNSMGVWRDVNLLCLPTFHSTVTNQTIGFLADGVSVRTQLAPDTINNPIAFVTFSANVRCFPVAGCANLSLSKVASLLAISTSYESIGTVSSATPLNASQKYFQLSLDEASLEARFLWSWETNPQLTVVNPQLWWPWQMGEQPLFDVMVQIDSMNATEPGLRFGLRQMTQTKTMGGAAQLLVNNVPLLIRGGGWAPDLFLRFQQETSDSRALNGEYNEGSTSSGSDGSFNPQAGGSGSRNDWAAPESRIRHQLELTKHMNLNTIRLEGKFEYKAFFDIASEMGILVIPGMECCTSWQNWPNWTPDMQEIAELSVRDQVRRLSHYACNIAFLASSDELPPPNVQSMYDNVFATEQWPASVIAAASEQVSTLTQSTGVKMTGPYSWVPPVYWLANSESLTGNYGGAWGFLTEGGPGEAPMTLNSWNRTVGIGSMWNASVGAMGEEWSFHMGNPLGVFHNLRRLVPALDARFGPSSSAKEFCYKSQLSNYEGIRAMFEGYERQKHKNATGVIQWMLNNAWPSNLWHLYDNYLIGGGGYYGAKIAGEHLHPMLSYVDGTVSVINNRFKDVVPPPPFTYDNVTYRTKLYVNVTAVALSSSSTTVIHQSLANIEAIPADASLDVAVLDLTAIGERAKQFSNDTYLNAAFLVMLQIVEADESCAKGETCVITATTPLSQRSTYILSTQMDVVNFTASNNLWSNCSQWADFTSLQSIAPLGSLLSFTSVSFGEVPNYPQRQAVTVVVSNDSPTTTALFVRVSAICAATGFELGPSWWNENYFTLLPGESLTVDGTLFVADCESTELILESYNDALSQS